MTSSRRDESSPRFVAARDDDQGPPVLSTFTGAAPSSPTLLVNPYDVDQMAEAVHRAFLMPANEQVDRGGACAARSASTTSIDGRSGCFPTS